MKTLEHRLAWLAGIIDGEGYITARVVASSHVKRDGAHGTQLIFTVGIGNTDWTMIEEILSVAAAVGVKTITTLMKRADVVRHKVAWKILFNGGKRTEAILSAVLPYLVNKRKRADIALAMIRHRRKTSRVVRGQSRFEGRPGFTDDAWLMQQLGDLKHLNRRGPAEVEQA